MKLVHEMSWLLCRDFQENPCHHMRAGEILPAASGYSKCWSNFKVKLLWRLRAQWPGACALPST